MIIWPNNEKCVNVSKTTSPVTQVALVEVNKASKKLVHVPALLAIGKQRSNVPIIIILKKLRANICM